MIQKLQKFFNTDKIVGRVLFFIFLYITYWVLFYIIIPLIIMVLQGFNFGGYILLFELLVLAPIISFKIPSIILKISKINKYLIYIIHTILVIIPIVVYIFLVLSAIRNGLSQMFI